MPKAHRRRFLGADDESTSGQKGLMLRCSNWVRFVNRNAEPSNALGKLARHEATLMNAFTKTLQMLLLLQENRPKRKGEPAVLEAVALPPAA